MTMTIEQNTALSIGNDISARKRQIEYYELLRADLKRAIMEYKNYSKEKRNLVIRGYKKNNEVCLYFNYLNNEEMSEHDGFYIQLSENEKIIQDKRELYAMKIYTRHGIEKNYFLIDIV